jgi:hypothetical protein
MSFLKSVKTYYVILLQIAMGLSNYAEDHQSINLSDGVVIDKTNNTVFVSHPTKGIDGVSLDSGLVVWHSDDAQKPLMLSGSELIAQAQSPIIGELLLVSLDKNSGAMIGDNRFVLPDNVIAPVSQGLEHKFKIEFDNSDGNLHWNHSYKLAQGMPTLPSKNPNSKTLNKKTYGSIVFNSSNKTNGVSLIEGAQLNLEPQKQKGVNFATEGLFIEQKEGRQFTSVSKHTILVSQLNDAASLTEKYKWGIYTFDNQLLGSFMHANSYRPFEVVGDVVLMTTLPQSSYSGGKSTKSPMMLNAYSLSIGEVKWTHEIKDFRYTGQYPQ